MYVIPSTLLSPSHHIRRRNFDLDFVHFVLPVVSKCFDFWLLLYYVGWSARVTGHRAPPNRTRSRKGRPLPAAAVRGQQRWLARC